MNAARQYVIHVQGPQPRYLALASAEEAGEGKAPVPTTAAPELALRFTDFTEARAELRRVVKAFVGTAFRIDLAPEAVPVRFIDGRTPGGLACPWRKDSPERDAAEDLGRDRLRGDCSDC